MSVSILTPKAFSMRRAILPESAALPFKRLDKAGRETCKAAAAAVTESPAGSMISVRMKSPGCGGFFMAIGIALSTLMIVFQIQVADFAIRRVNAKRQTTVARYGQAPSALAVAGQGVRLPGGEGAQFFRVLHGVEKGKHLAELVRRIGRNAFCAALRVERPQAFVSEVPNPHMVNCSL
jgi:hypothetical protein